jgi:hypothetical protein
LYGIIIVSLAQLVILAKLDQISVGLGDIKVDMSEVDFTWVVLLLPNRSKGSPKKIKSLKLGTLSQPLLTPCPPTELGTPYVFERPNKLVGTHSSPTK